MQVLQKLVYYVKIEWKIIYNNFMREMKEIPYFCSFLARNKNPLKVNKFCQMCMSTWLFAEQNSLLVK